MSNSLHYVNPLVAGILSSYQSWGSISGIITNYSSAMKLKLKSHILDFPEQYVALAARIIDPVLRLMYLPLHHYVLVEHPSVPSLQFASEHWGIWTPSGGFDKDFLALIKL